MQGPFIQKALLFLFSCCFVNSIYSQNPLEKFSGNWKLKGGKWEWREDGKYQFWIDSSIYSNAVVVPDNGLLWDYNLGGGNYGKIMWTFNVADNKIYWLSENSNGPMGRGESIIQSGDSIVFKNYFDGVEGYRRYVFKLNSDKELFLRASFYVNDKPTGNFYGGTWVKE